jgi:hypothetical protein
MHENDTSIIAEEEILGANECVKSYRVMSTERRMLLAFPGI